MLKYFIFSKFRLADSQSEKINSKTEYEFLSKSYVYDKFSHFNRDFFIFGFLMFLSNYDILLSLSVSMFFSILWEIKDSVLFYIDCPSDAPFIVRWFYGDGFSIVDIVCGYSGILLNVLLYLIMVKIGLIEYFLFSLFSLSIIFYLVNMKISKNA